jgi:hypothetical protein
MTNFGQENSSPQTASPSKFRDLLNSVLGKETIDKMIA